MPNEVDVEVGCHIKALRRKSGMRQMDLATHLRVSVQLIRKYEGGRVRIGSSRLAAIADALDVPVSCLVDCHKAHFENSAGRELVELTVFIATKEGLALNRAFRRIKSSKIRRSLLELIGTCSR